MTLQELLVAGFGFISSLVTYLIGHTHGKVAGAAQAAQKAIDVVKAVDPAVTK